MLLKKNRMSLTATEVRLQWEAASSLLAKHRHFTGDRITGVLA
jgi:hypothetical protein